MSNPFHLQSPNIMTLFFRSRMISKVSLKTRLSKGKEKGRKRKVSWCDEPKGGFNEGRSLKRETQNRRRLVLPIPANALLFKAGCWLAPLRFLEESVCVLAPLKGEVWHSRQPTLNSRSAQCLHRCPPRNRLTSRFNTKINSINKKVEKPQKTVEIRFSQSSRMHRGNWSAPGLQGNKPSCFYQDGL